MILFRRFGEAFRGIEAREWALLTLETIGVVAGILIAFELNEWAARRNEAATHRQLMERLFEETQLDVVVLRGWREAVRSIVGPEKSFAVALAKGECPSLTSWDAVTTVNMMPAVTAPTSVYQELTGAGGLSSVDREDVRKALARFHGSLDWTQRQVDYFRAARVTPLEPSDKRVRVVFDPTRDEPEVWTFSRAALCADQSFRNRMAAATRAHAVYANYWTDLADDAIAMCASLGESLGKACVPQDGALKGDDAKLAAKLVAKMRAPAKS
jgi:hypothetical protein